MNTTSDQSFQEILLTQVNQLILVANDSMRTMAPESTKRLRSSTKNLILKCYGSKSAFDIEFRKIGGWDSQDTLSEIKGILLAIKDDIAHDLIPGGGPQIQSEHELENKRLETLTGDLLKLFYNNVHYNWEAISNLIKFNADYFDFTIAQAQSIYNKFIERKMIAFTGLGQAYCITAEGKRLYETKYKPPLPHSDAQLDPRIDTLTLPDTVNDVLLSNKPKTMTEIFLSYSWDSGDHQQKVAAFVNFLRENGYQAEMDLMLSEKETAIDFARMMHKAMHLSKKIIIVLSPGYKQKAENFEGGVGQEYSLLFKDIEKSPQKYILVSFAGIADDIIPFGLRGREIVDCALDNWEQKLFSKLEDKVRYVFSEVSSTKPVIKTISPAKFLEQLNRKSKKIKQDNAAKIKASLRMEQKLKKDIVDNKMMEEREERIGMYPGTSTIFVTNRVIIRSIDDSHYPEVDAIPEGPMSSWVREHFYDLSSGGVEIWLEAALGTKIIMDKDGFWEILANYEDPRQDDPRYKSARIMVIGVIPYFNIIEYRKNGDEYYNEPHLFCHFDFEGTPFSKFKYKVYFDEKADLPTYNLEVAKKTKFPLNKTQPLGEAQ